VARFLGGSNILRGKAIDATRLSFAGAAIECSGGTLMPGTDGSASIRQHDVRITDREPEAGNTVPATVVRNVFLGATRDYVVEVAGGAQLRVTASPEGNFTPGTAVWLTLPPERCRALAG
jgi:iron(III) transport system ATP-binding protein